MPRSGQHCGMDTTEDSLVALASAGDGPGLQRLQFELALDMSATDQRPPVDTLTQAAETAGAEVVFVLPTPRGKGITAVVRLVDEGRDYFLQVRSAEQGFAVADEAEMSETLLGLARASVDVMQRLSADGGFQESRAA